MSTSSSKGWKSASNSAASPMKAAHNWFETPKTTVRRQGACHSRGHGDYRNRRPHAGHEVSLSAELSLTWVTEGLFAEVTLYNNTFGNSLQHGLPEAQNLPDRSNTAIDDGRMNRVIETRLARPGLYEYARACNDRSVQD